MNSRAPHDEPPHLAERVTRLEDRLESKMDKMYHTMVFGGLGAVITILIGVAGINMSLLSGMTQAFQVGADGGAKYVELRRDLGEHDKRLAAIETQMAGMQGQIAGVQEQVAEIRKILEEDRAARAPARRTEPPGRH